MTFTGSNTGSPDGSTRLLDIAPSAARHHARPSLRVPLSPPRQDRPPAPGLNAVASRTAEWLIDRQADDGHWRGPLEGDTILESEYLLILAWAGRLGGPVTEAAARRILAEQLPEGGWAIYPGGPVDVSASVKAYFALKLTGHDPQSPELSRARRAIAAAGGPWAVNSFTKFYLALLGQLPYSACPAVPPEMVLLPDWFPVNLLRVSAWSRTMIVPLSLMWAFKPVRTVPEREGISELFAATPMRRSPDAGGWARFFRGVDRVMKACEALGLVPLRARAVQACRRWMLERFDGSDGLGAIFPPIVWSIVALRALGCDEDSPEVRECWRQLDRLVEHEADGSVRLEPCRSPVWDTAITAIGLVEAAALRESEGREMSRAATAGIDWLLANEVRGSGDWARGVPAASRVEPSGWSFQYANRFYPDIDDTAMVVIALVTWQRHAARQANAGGDPRWDLVTAAIGRATRWLLAMQSSDGGWGAFDRDNNLEILCKVPFADHNAMIDPSTPDIAGRVLEAFGKAGLRHGHPAVDRGIEYLRRVQEPTGAWFGRWGVNYVYGTWQALEGLRAVGVGLDDPCVSRAADWLEAHQQADGGWGESPESYADPGLAGVGPTTASQTAWGLAGLVAAGRGGSAVVGRGLAWLADRQQPDGTWSQPEFTGTGFPQVFYLRYHYYPIYFPLVAICRGLSADVNTGWSS
ncbi:MAG: squalene--hopene cyclase [Planctomycetota bacterium]|nr:MAG: squalene--hopene cyclase [Planctomycetota bacterium]